MSDPTEHGGRKRGTVFVGSETFSLLTNLSGHHSAQLGIRRRGSHRSRSDQNMPQKRVWSKNAPVLSTPHTVYTGKCALGYAHAARTVDATGKLCLGYPRHRYCFAALQIVHTWCRVHMYFSTSLWLAVSLTEPPSKPRARAPALSRRNP